MNIEEITKALETEVLCENCPHNGSDRDERGCYYIEAAKTIKELKARAEKAEARRVVSISEVGTSVAARVSAPCADENWRNTMRLIDADALKKTIKNMPNDYYGDLCVGDALKEIDNAPTIDAVPVVRGEWVEAKSGVMSVWPPGQVMCSVCGQRMPSQWKKMPPYCYGCGAKMK